MKTMKKVFALVLTLVMCLGLVKTAFAATITVNDDNVVGKYVAYQIFTEDENGYQINGKYSSALNAAMSAVGATQSNVLLYLDSIKDDADAARAFADALYQQIKGMEPDYTAEEDGTTIKDVANGYVLVAEEKENKQGAASVTFLYVVDGDLPLTPKNNEPEVEKKADKHVPSLGEDVTYTLDGSISNKYDLFETYYYKFTDTMSTGLTYTAGSAKVYVERNGQRYEITTQATIETSTNENGETVLTVTFDDLKDVTLEGVEPAEVTVGDHIVVEYTAQVNENAVTGVEGNPNKVVLEYNNDPYWNEDGTPPEPGTDDDTEIVFTFDLKLDKIDGNTKQPLTGATFAIYRKVDGQEVLVKEIDGTNLSEFNFKGLGEGDFVLKETTTPEGYAEMDPIEFSISYNPDTKEFTVTSNGVFKGTLEPDGTTVKANLEAQIANYPDAELPSTGGIGTTLFYVIGAALIIGAGVLLVTKKRIGNKD